MESKLKHPSDMRELGFTIDDTCYPWVAYKGPRFAPTESHWCYTDRESYFIIHGLELVEKLYDAALLALKLDLKFLSAGFKKSAERLEKLINGISY